MSLEHVKLLPVPTTLLIAKWQTLVAHCKRVKTSAVPKYSIDVELPLTALSPHGSLNSDGIQCATLCLCAAKSHRGIIWKGSENAIFLSSSRLVWPIKTRNPMLGGTATKQLSLFSFSVGAGCWFDPVAACHLLWLFAYFASHLLLAVHNTTNCSQSS